MLIEVSESGHSPADLKVIGLGGAGGNAVDRMLETDIRGVEFLVANTDIQALNASSCPNRIQIGAAITGGLGSGGDPAIGRKSAEEDREVLREHLEGADELGARLAGVEPGRWRFPRRRVPSFVVSQRHKLSEQVHSVLPYPWPYRLADSLPPRPRPSPHRPFARKLD